jgi:hypothetical protein
MQIEPELLESGDAVNVQVSVNLLTPHHELLIPSNEHIAQFDY